jgi:hypothetical protein
MRTWSKIGCVVAMLGLVACNEAAATPTVKRPAELLVTISLGPDRTLDHVRAFANTVQPGTGAVLTQAIVRRGLAELSGASSLDGLDPMAPTYVLLIDGGAQLNETAVVGKVLDEKTLVTGLGSAHSAINAGWAVIGSEAVVRKIGSYALTALPPLPVVASPTAVVYVPQVLRRYRTEIDAGRKQLAAQMAATQSSAQMTGMMQSYVDGLFSVVSDTDQLLVTIDVTKDLGAIDLAVTPKPGSRLAKFVAAQRASDYALLDKLPAVQAPVVVAGHIESGPYRQGMLDVFAAMYGQGESKELIATMSAIMKAATGDLAMVMQVGIGQPMTITQLFGVADKKAVDKSIDRVLALFKVGRTFDSSGISTTIKSNAQTIEHDGVSIRGYDVTYDMSKVPAAKRAIMEKMIPAGTSTAGIATFDQVGLLTLRSTDPGAAIDAARGKGSHFAPSAAIADFLTGSRARQESFMMVMDFGAILGTPGPARSLMMSAGFADKTAHLRFSLPAQTVRALSGQP